MATTKLMTAEDLYRMEDDGWRHELIRGELIQMPPASHRHSKLAVRIARRLGDFVEEHQLGDVTGADGGYILSRDPDVVVAPDAAFVRADRLPPDEDVRTYLELAPDLIVEVVSPSDRMNDVSMKVILYLDAGTHLVWVVQPTLKTVTVHYPDRTSKTLTIDNKLDGGDVLPGFKLAVSDLFS
jgi:Uma2 family endonuclease